MYIETAGGDKWVSQDVTVTNNEYYFLGIWVKAPSAGAVTLALQDHYSYADIASVSCPGTGVWEYLRLFARPTTVRSGFNNARVRIHVHAPAYAYVSNVRIDLI